MACSDPRAAPALSRRHLLALGPALLLAGAVPAPAQTPPSPPARPAAGSPPAAADVPAWTLVQREHEDRVMRLTRYAAGRMEFSFTQEEIAPAEHGLPDYPVPLPVLRVTARQDAFFDSGSDVIRPEAYDLIDIIARNLRNEVPDVAVFIAGHTDSDGTAEYNLALGLRRAEAVAAALVRRGIYQAEVYRISFGEALPVASNATAEGRARNRRVEFLFAARPPAIVKAFERQKVEACSEAFRDGQGRCRESVRFVAARVIVPPEYQRKVLELARKAEALRLDRSLAPVEVEKRRQAIEVERQRVPIEFSVERIPIDIGGLRPGTQP